jgi:hypothetical protein
MTHPSVFQNATPHLAKDCCICIPVPRLNVTGLCVFVQSRFSFIGAFLNYALRLSICVVHFLKSTRINTCKDNFDRLQEDSLHNLSSKITVTDHESGRSQWPRALRHELYSLARTLRSWVRIPLKARMSVCVYSVFVFFCV